MAHKENLIVAGMLAIIGSPFVLTGGILSLWLPQRIEQRIATIEDLPVATIASFKEPVPLLLVEGVIEDRAVPPTEGFLIYRELYRTTEDGETTWETWDTATPEFWVKLPSGRVKVAGQYRIENAAHTTEADDRRYEGLQAGDWVLVIGTILEDEDPPTVAAQIVSADTQATYVEYLRASQTFPRWFGAIFGSIGLLLMGVASVLVLESWPYRGQGRSQ